ncbi:MAG: hypothetical protein ACFFFO_17900 [Candidatus Thorarchaeota archaeon]
MLRNRFSEKGNCILDTTDRLVRTDNRIDLDNVALLSLSVERKFPDLIGCLDTSEALFSEESRLIVVKIKRGVLTLSDLYQVKMYAEVLQAYYAVLISPSGFQKEQRRAIIEIPELLNYFAQEYDRQIVVMYWRKNTLEIDEELYDEDPLET